MFVRAYDDWLMHDHQVLCWLQCHKSTIPSHTVYATNMERIVNQLWHQSNEEMMHDELHRDELRRKQQTTSWHLSVQRRSDPYRKSNALYSIWTKMDIYIRELTGSSDTHINVHV